MLCSLLALGLVAHGQDSAPVAAPPDPAPSQSHTEPVEVALGDNGGTVTLMITEDGDYTLDGEPFTGGADNPVEGAGGRTYVLTLADGTWSAAFVPMTQTVSLGTSGDEVELLTTEAGTWMLAETALAGDGSDTYTTAGRDYVLELGDDGTWTASFVPMTQSVTLGTSGDTVTLTSTEAGGWALGSSSVADGYVATAENGSRYSLTLGADGTWAAAFVPTAVPVSLGASGESVTLMTTEAGGYTLDGTAVEAGASLTSTVGERYALAVGEDGMWMATHVPDQRTVLLGNSGVTIELMTSETGTWMRGDASVSSGEIVIGGINEISGAANEYELTLADGTWTATYRPETQSIKGTGLTASVREDGQGYTVGSATLPASGAGELAAADGALYRVAKGADGTLAGARFDRPVVGDVIHENSIGTHDAPSLSTDDRKTDTDETGTLLNVLGASLSMGDLLGAGTAVASGPNMVAGARQQMVKIRDRAAGLVALRRDGGLDSESFRVQVGRQWAAADTLVNRLFGTTGATLERTTSVSRVVDAFDRIVDALSSEEAFAAATLADGPNQLQGFKTRNATQAVQAFNRVAWTASGTLGTLGSTRFGAAVYNSTNNVTAGLGDAERAQGFAWSTMEATRRASDVQTSGEAYYMGVTHAADQDGNLYEGDIDVLVRFATEKVDGLVSQLARTDTGAFWSYGLGGEVTSITLPPAELNRRGAWRVRARNAAGRLSYIARAGSSEDFAFSGGEFSGQLLGRDDAAGAEALGTWKVEIGSSVLAGGFGVERVESPAQRAAATRAQNRFQAALAEAGLEDRGTVDQEDPEAVSAVVNQFQAALEASGYSATAVATAVASYRSAVLSVSPGQSPFRVALSTFSAARTAGTLVLATDSTDPAAAVADDLTVSGAVTLRADSDGYLDVPVAGSTSGNRVTRKTTIDRTNNKLIVAAASATEPSTWGCCVPPKYEVDLETIFGDEYLVESPDNLAQSASREIKRDTHVETAHKEITKLYNQLQKVIELGDDAFANERRQSIFDAIQAQLSTEIFGSPREPGVAPGLTTSSALSGAAAANWNASHTDYPANSAGVAQDRTVLAEVEALLDVLAEEDAFAEAFDSGGIFEGLNAFDSTGDGENNAAIPARFIFNKEKTRILLRADTTDFTRFGVWIRHTSYFANHNKGGRAWYLDYNGYRDQQTYGEPFAYSPLDQVTYASHTDFAYPGRGASGPVRATYSGTTTALQHTIFYTGGLEATVYWDNDAVSGALSVEFTNPTATDPDFGTMRHGLRDYPNPDQGNRLNKFKPGTYDVAALVFRADITSTADNKIGFTGSTLRAEYNREVKGNRSSPDLVAPVINEMWLSNGRLSIHHSGQNQISAMRRASGDRQTNRLQFLDTSDLPANGTSTIVRAGTGGNTTTVDAFNSIFEDHPTTRLELLSIEYGRYEGQAPKYPYVLLTFADGTTVQQFVGDLANSGTAWSASQTEMGRGASITVSQGGPLFDEFFTSGKGKGYLNIGYPIGPPALTGTGSFTRTQFFAKEFEAADVGNRDTNFGRPLNDAGIATRGIDIAAGTTAVGTFYTTAGASSVGLSAGLSTTARIDGQFVGPHAEGPLGIIGVFALPGNVIHSSVNAIAWRDHWFGVGNTRAEIVGAFGADFAP